MEIKIDTERLSVEELRALIKMFNELLRHKTHKEEPVEIESHVENNDNIVGGFASMFSNDSGNKEENNSNDEDNDNTYSNEIQLY